jgi:hypothetical protein
MKLLPLISAVAALSLAGPAFAQTVALKGPDGQSASLTAADLAALPQVKFTVTHHGKTSTFEGASLADVVARVGAASGKGVRGPELATVIRVTAKDGYQVVFGLAETDPGTRKGRIILADRGDGAPLKEDGPFRLVVEDDLRPARSARMVETIEVIRLANAKSVSAEHKH